MNKVRLPEARWDKKWQVTTLGEICDIQIGRTPPTKSQQYWNGPYTWVSISDMNSRVVVNSERTITDQAIEEGKARLVKQGTLLMSFKLTIGKLAFAGKDLFTNEAIAALVIKDEYKEEVIPEYLYWVLQVVPLEEGAALAVKGKTINQTTMRAIRLPLPESNEQRRIVAQLESLLAEAREIRALQAEIEVDAGRLMDAFYEESYPDEHGSLPDGWAMLIFPDVCQINPTRPRIVRELSTPTSFVPMSAVDEITGSIVAMETPPYENIRSGYRYFEENDVLFAKITPCMQNGKAAIAKNLIDGFGFGSTEFHVLRPKPGVLSEWIYHYIRRTKFRNEAMQRFRGAAGQQRVPSDFLENHVIPVPYPDNLEKSLIAQRQLVTHFEAVKHEVIEMLKLTKEDDGRLDTLEQAILAQAFRGGI